MKLDSLEDLKKYKKKNIFIFQYKRVNSGCEIKKENRCHLEFIDNSLYIISQ